MLSEFITKYIDDFCEWIDFCKKNERNVDLEEYCEEVPKKCFAISQASCNR